MQDKDLDNAIASGRTYGNPDVQHALFSTLRREDAVHWTQPEGFRPFWAVTKAADIMEVERQQELFINAPRAKLLPIEWEQRVREITGGRPVLVRSLPQMDGAEHKVYRQLTQAWFQPKQVKSIEGRIAQFAKRSVAELAAHRGGCDFYREVAVWYPLRIILMIMGLPESDAPELLRITERFFGAGGNAMHQGGDFIAAAEEYIAYFDEVARARRAKPTDDVASLIANATIDGQPIGHHEASSYYIALASAGHDTTSATASGGLLALIQNPEQWQLLKANPALVTTAVDEMVRWVSPVKHFMRTATQDYVLRGRQIRLGDHLMMCYPSGNRDEDVFDEPFRFRIDRSPNRHVGFGYGAHACLGMFLAKIELHALFREILSVFDHFELDGTPAWQETSFVGGVSQLPVRFTMQSEKLTAAEVEAL